MTERERIFWIVGKLGTTATEWEIYAYAVKLGLNPQQTYEDWITYFMEINTAIANND